MRIRIAIIYEIDLHSATADALRLAPAVTVGNHGSHGCARQSSSATGISRTV